MFEQLPFLGAGLAYRAERHEQILAHREAIDFLELPTDVFLNTLPDSLGRLLELKEAFPTVAHGIYMSLGDASGPHLDYLERLAPYIELLQPVWFSDHVDMGNVPDDPLGRHFHGMQVPFTREQAEVFHVNMRVMQERIRLPLLVENVAYDFVIPMPGSLPEPQFLCELLSDTEAGLLLDLTNLQINALNFGFDPYAWLEQAPLEQAVEIHVAGGEIMTSGFWAGRWADTHSQPVPDEVWRMLEFILPRAPVKAVILERDQRPPPIEALLAELRIARSILGAQAVTQGANGSADSGCDTDAAPVRVSKKGGD
jgi:uncharacterized protein (UPF0276 family)